MASLSRSLTLSPPPSPPIIHRHLTSIRPHLTAFPRRHVTTISCVSNGGVSSDDYFVSTRKWNFDRGFCVISNMLKRIEPLDSSVVSQGVSDAARDSMKQTISSMLGLLPSEQFSVTVGVSRVPLYRLLVSSIITGYTLWNAEYRISLTRNLDISPNEGKGMNCSEGDGVRESGVKSIEVEGKDGEVGSEVSVEGLERSPNIFGDLSPEALNYIQQLQSELDSAEEELNVQKQKSSTLEYERHNRNDLLEYLRSLDPDMVTELSRPSSPEVDDVIHQLVQNILRKFFKEDASSHLKGVSDVNNVDSHPDADNSLCDSICTSRDFLAKLLFWCMLMGHHLRGLENRLHLSCVVGLL